MKKKALITLPLCVVLIALIAVSFILIKSGPGPAAVDQEKKVAAFAKPAVVRIFEGVSMDWEIANPGLQEYFGTTYIHTEGWSMGSGAIINPNGYIITNAHVVEASNEKDEYKIAELMLPVLFQTIEQDYGIQLTQEDMNVIAAYFWPVTGTIQKQLKVVLPGGDIFDADIKSFGAPVGEGKDVAVLKIDGKNLPTLKVGNSDDVQLQDEVQVLGYPAAAESEALSPESSLEVTVTNGSVSATNKKTQQGSPVIQIDASATHGNSGGPVLNSKGEIVGLLTFRGDTVNGQEVQGFNFVVPSNTVKEFMAQAGAKNEEGVTDVKYKEGLELYWGGYYTEAVRNFEEVQRLFPNHSEVKKLISDSQSKTGDSKFLWSSYSTIFYIVDAVLGLVILGLLVFTFIPSGKKETPKKEEEQDKNNLGGSSE